MKRKSELQIYSFNCQSFFSKRVIIDTILKKCDVLCLQETFICVTVYAIILFVHFYC